MSRERVDPIERALDAYFALTEMERQVFVKAAYYRQKYAGTTGENRPEVKRGRPPGSKNRKPADVAPTTTDIELVEKLFGNNGAITEGV